MPKDHAAINESMVKVAPELASKYATYPMKRKLWLAVDGKVDDDNDIPAFIAHPKPEGTSNSNNSSPARKSDYVWGPGPFSFGYYHLLTRPAYEILYHRIRNELVTICSCFGGGKKSAISTGGIEPTRSEIDEVVTMMYNRSIASRPDDFLAQKEAFDLAQGIAQSHYHFGQNFQLVLMATT
mmetsp:Transcript_14840/g.21234  ORF Transcript_14840/g.21234 Transcript_14840/m.21234 type:complete len:182 (-) Transcript_14840:303-848(-)|eukprot:CAMPEP_0184867888 /NCGR_PEP_ID=MMETSP0580-20130426/28111_1 /TAXON_ID=1118495 /ORGANISM="Dactyliosolen fragilissimus" /LENGTH=181 /DNA_ID=CAMNT_0027368389 /DNA_START=106 /DNA_END=651 /DNA_ORIENTATION=-